MRNTNAWVPAALVGALLAGGAGLGAMFVTPEIVQVPIARLVANLERKSAEDPLNVEHRINLARLHGMAFALKTEDVRATPHPGGEEQPWYGQDSKLVPYRNRNAPTPAAAATAEKHLQKALEHYDEALKLDGNNLLALIGNAWMLEQAGHKARAIEHYRRVINLAWASEKETRMLKLGRRLFTHEAIEYLLPLLDPAVDAAEIKELRDRQQTLARLPRAVTPIAVPLTDGLRGARVHDHTARVRFDADGSGLRREWTWIDRGAGWLVYDSSGKAAITSALQLFGSVTFWLFWENGYQALAALDDDNDGEIRGMEMERIAIWMDMNRNGTSEPGEVAPLTAHGIVALSCKHEEGDGITFAAVSHEGVRLADGRSRPTYDVILRASPRSLTLLRQP